MIVVDLQLYVMHCSVQCIGRKSSKESLGDLEVLWNFLKVIISHSLYYNSVGSYLSVTLLKIRSHYF